jgi:hypothetical protein
MQLAQGVRRLTEVPGRINGFCTLAWEVYTLHPPAALLVISGVETPSANELTTHGSVSAKAATTREITG